MPSFPDNVGPGLFVPTTDIFDVSQLEGKDLSSPEFRQFIIRLIQRLNNIALSLNLKDTGIYSLSEFVNSQVYFPNPALSSTTSQAPTQRQVFRKIIDFGALPNAGTKSVAHGITVDANTSFTRIYATATDPVAFLYIPIPFVSNIAIANNISISVDATNVNITTGVNRTNFTICYVVLEYLKN